MNPNHLISFGAVKSRIAAFRRARRKIVFTNGVFDILHRGHVEYLAKAKSFGDILLVGLNTDASVRRIKGNCRPVQSERDRAAVLLALRSVDFVVLFDQDTPADLIALVRPDILVKGADYRPSEIVGADLVRSYGGKVRRVRLTPGRSTSRIIGAMSKK
jgi:D-beta-D-heptose 7-phosphate kinase/D-beta-D-heptose 1-phosphate adenosyltransferase